MFYFDSIKHPGLEAKTLKGSQVPQVNFNSVLGGFNNKNKTNVTKVPESVIIDKRIS